MSELWQQKSCTSSRSSLLSMKYGHMILPKNRISSRLISLLKVAINVAAEAAIDTGVNALITKACKRIEISLQSLYKRTARNSIITFTINLLGIFLLLRCWYMPTLS